MLCGRAFQQLPLNTEQTANLLHSKPELTPNLMLPLSELTVGNKNDSSFINKRARCHPRGTRDALAEAGLAVTLF